MAKSNYQAKESDPTGKVFYTDEENETWHILLKRQLSVIQNRACNEFMAGLENLSLPQDRVPQCQEVTARLQETTGWAVHPVPALISLKEFFTLLANKKFPAATFIRTREELDYLKEPDIFHEFFGHCPLLTNKAYADFVEWYGKTALTTDSPKIHSLLGRIFWFTIEFGLLQSQQGLKIYGGGILSSFEETVFSLENPNPKRVKFEIHQVLNTNYRYDQIQERYYVLNSLDELYTIQNLDIVSMAQKTIDEPDQQDFNIC